MALLKMKSLVVALFLLTFPIVQDAWGHTRWNPEGLIKPRSNGDDIKAGPCGHPRGDNPVVLQSGAVVTVEFESTIFHQGYFRIAFSEANDEGFDDYVLAAEIPDYAGQRYRSHDITLPDIECDRCTLQLIQSMLDRSPPTNYFSCADIQLTRSGTSEPNPSDTTPPSPVTALMATEGDGYADLYWNNPTEPDFFRVLILQSTESNSTRPTDGEAYQPGDRIGSDSVAYRGVDSDVRIDNLTSGNEYVFTAFSYDQQLNYSVGTETAVTLSGDSANVAPIVNLVVEQNQTQGTNIASVSGNVIVQADVVDLNPRDNHSFDWSASDDRLSNISDSESQFVFDPSELSSGRYSVTVEVGDDGTPALNGSDTVTLVVTTDDSGSNTGGGALNVWGLLSLLSLLGLVMRARARA